jgi:hypothetical protein
MLRQGRLTGLLKTFMVNHVTAHCIVPPEQWPLHFGFVLGPTFALALLTRHRI